MFKFGFFDSTNETVDESPVTEKTWRDAEQVEPKSCSLTDKQKSYGICNHVYGDVTVKSFKETDVIEHLKTTEDMNCIIKAEFDHSDLVTAEYEGGLKIWECTIDLINYLNDIKIEFQNKRVLDLGCGCGILGIFTLLQGATVDFQDYNKEVIDNITIPNVILNCDEDETKFQRCYFYSGDWKSLSNCLENGKYDYILTSETIYNADNYQKLHDIFSTKLKSNGIVYLAAKSYYFGVGGSTRQFEKYLKSPGVLQSSVSWKCTDGVQREILKIIKI